LDRLYFVGRSDDETAPLRLWRKERDEIDPKDLSGDLVQLGRATDPLNRHWYERITARMPVGRDFLALCYATTVILVGYWPWNILLILPVLLSKNRNSLCLNVFVTSEESVRSKASCVRGGSL